MSPSKWIWGGVKKFFAKTPQERVAEFLIKKDVDITKPVLGVPTPLTMIRDIEEFRQEREPETPASIFFGKSLVRGAFTPIVDVSKFGLEKVAKPVVKFIGPPPQEGIIPKFLEKIKVDITEPLKIPRALKIVSGVPVSKVETIPSMIADIERARQKEQDIEKMAKIQYDN